MSNLTALLNKYKALVIFDTETSGLDFDKDQIIELAALRVERTASGGLRIAGLHISPETMQQILEAFDRVAEAVKEMARALMEALKPIIDWAKKTAERFMEALAAGIVPRKWLHLAKHAKKARTRKKYRNRIRRAVFAALAAEGGGSS